MKLLWQSLVSVFAFTLLTGAAYPLLITGVGQLLWHDKAMGSLVKDKNIVRGSALIAQKFTKPEYFWPRPSAGDYNAVPSSASNLGPTSKALKTQIHKNRMGQENVPLDLITTSGSGLDPHISPRATAWQMARVTKARNLDDVKKAELQQLVDLAVEKSQLGALGMPRVNVLLLNSLLDDSFGKMGS